MRPLSGRGERKASSDDPSSMQRINFMGIISNFIPTDVTRSNLFRGDFGWDYFPTFKFSLNSTFFLFFFLGIFINIISKTSFLIVKRFQGFTYSK
jgi:hypothetical protein